MTELAARLKTCSLFEEMPEDELEYLASLAKVQRHPPGTVVVRQGDAGDAFYVVLSGHLEVLWLDDQKSGPLIITRPGITSVRGPFLLANPGQPPSGLWMT